MRLSDGRPDPHALFGAHHDAHMHLDFAINGEELAARARDAGLAVFANTVSPEGFEAARKRFAGFENVHVGLGMHPWWVDGSFDPAAFERLASTTQLVGEVGLDFSDKHAENREAQLDAFTWIANICARQGAKLLSLHAVKSAETVLDILEGANTLATCTCVFHWFSDSGDALARAREDGCYFSINPMMLATRRGREYVRQLPSDRLLVETDAPPGEGIPYEFTAWTTAIDEVRQALDGKSNAVGNR